MSNAVIFLAEGSELQKVVAEQDLTIAAVIGDEDPIVVNAEVDPDSVTALFQGLTVTSEDL